MNCFLGCEPPEGGGGEHFYVMALPDLTVYGHSIDAWTQANYPEDLVHTQASRRNGMEFGCWHSTACVDGEVGSNQRQSLVEISYEDFVAARDAGWPRASFLTSTSPASMIGTVNDDGTVREVWNSLEGDVDRTHPATPLTRAMTKGRKK